MFLIQPTQHTTIIHIDFLEIHAALGFHMATAFIPHHSSLNRQTHEQHQETKMVMQHQHHAVLTNNKQAYS
jgi:hypothetical protein